MNQHLKTTLNTFTRLPLLQIGIIIALLLPAKRLIALGELFGNLSLVLFFYALILIAAVAWLFFSSRSLARGLFGKFDWHYLVKGLLWGVGLFIVGGVGYAMNQIVFGLPQPTETRLFASGGTSALLVVGIILIGPILEEYIFRGLLLRYLLDKVSVFYSIIISASLFSVYHLSIFQLLPTFLWGIGFAFLAYRNKSLWPVLVAHLVVNSLGFALFFLFQK